VRCWGNGADGRLGYGNTSSIGDDESPASAGDVPLGEAATFIAAGTQHTCAVLVSGAVRCWGAGADGRLGYGDTISIGDTEPPSDAGDVVLGGAAVEVVAGARHTCALLTTGDVKCWGAGVDGRLGTKSTVTIGDDEDPTAVQRIKIGTNVTHLSAGPTHTCALLITGDVLCWGTATGGRLGYANTNNVGDNEDPASAGPVFAMGAVMQVAAGSFHTCVLGDAGQVRCWGTNSGGELGYGNTIQIGDDELPRVAGDVDVGGKVTQITAGSGFTCALLEGGAVRCWGVNDGRLGYPNVGNIGDNESPASAGDVDLGGPAIQISAGVGHACAVLVGGKLRCWGDNSFGQLGYGNEETIGDDETPASAGDVPVGGTVVQVTAAQFYTCARFVDGTMRCWGFGGDSFGSDGNLGYGFAVTVGDDETPASMPVVPVGAGVLDIAAGDGHTCAVTTTNHVKCWGLAGEGRLGYGNTTKIGDNETPSSVGDVPVLPVGDNRAITQVSVGGANTCALIAGGSVRCWGSGFNGRLGQGGGFVDNVGDNETPATLHDIVLGSPATQIVTGQQLSCARLANGRLRCWGSGTLGILGFGNQDNIGDNENPADVGFMQVF
jgi:alpha-tubulin suppressor-like RCC1 family protein